MEIIHRPFYENRYAYYFKKLRIKKMHRCSIDIKFIRYLYTFNNIYRRGKGSYKVRYKSSLLHLR